MKLVEEERQQKTLDKTNRKRVFKKIPTELAKKPIELLFIDCNILNVFNIPNTCRIICTFIY